MAYYISMACCLSLTIICYMIFYNDRFLKRFVQCWLKVLTHTCWDFWKGTWIEFHPFIGWLITLQTLLLCTFRPRVLLLAGQEVSSRPWEACNHLYHWEFCLQILYCDCWVTSFMVWVLLCVEEYIASVVVGFSMWLEVCTCLTPTNAHT